MKPERYAYHFALSFAGEDRPVAEELARSLQLLGFRVFYDLDERADLWGKDLVQHLQLVYRDDALYCIVIVSAHYARKKWTRHELHQAQARAFEECREYILPLRLDDTELPGINATVGYIDLRTTGIAQVAALLAEKVNGPARWQIESPGASSGYDLAEGHCAPSGTFSRVLAIPPLCGGQTFPCLSAVESTSGLLRSSQWFEIDSEPLRIAIAQAARCEREDVDDVWSMALGPPLTHVLVAVIDGQLVALKMDIDGRTFTPVELHPPFPSPGRRDTRAAAAVDLFQDGERQLLLASDGVTGSGLGQSIMAVYRLCGGRLVHILEAELDFNCEINFGAGLWERRSAAVRWSSGPDGRPRVTIHRTRELGSASATRFIEYEWNGERFSRVGNPDDDRAEADEERRFREEEARVLRQGRAGDPGP